MGEGINLLKVRHFESIFPHAVESVEWRVKWPLNCGGSKTYNPDYWCQSLGSFIEVVTSLPNVSEQGIKWRTAIRLGYKLRVFWWTGEEVTDWLFNGSSFYQLDKMTKSFKPWESAAASP